MKTKPRVSVIIPVFNGAEYLGEAIDSALAQTYSDREVIVINDGSTDGGKTEQVALSYGAKIRYFSKPNGGVASALNYGIEKARGEFISWLSHDDVFYPNKLEEQMSLVETFNEPVILYSDLEMVNAKGEHISFVKVRGAANVLLAMFTGYPLNGCTMLIPKAAFSQVGYFDEALRTTQDYEMWFRMLPYYKFIHMAKPLLKSRLHAGQGSVTIDARNERAKLYIGALQQFSLQQIFGPNPNLQFSKYMALSLGLKLLDVEEASLYARELALRSVSGRVGLKVRCTYVIYLTKWHTIDKILGLKKTMKTSGLGKKVLRIVRRLLSS